METDWDKRAVLLAQEHFESGFSKRQGVIELIAENAFYLFNNSPPRENLTERDRKRDLLREEAAKVGIRELSYGEYPTRGAEEGYSFVLVFEGGENERKQLKELVRKIFGGVRNKKGK